jgi:hypothetical protein
VLADYIMSTFAKLLDYGFGMNKWEGQDRLERQFAADRRRHDTDGVLAPYNRHLNP